MPRKIQRATPSWAGITIALWVLITVVAATKLAVVPYKHSVFPVYVAGVGDWLAGKHVYIERPGIDLYRYPPPSLPMFALFYPWHISIGVALWTIAGSSGLYMAAEQVRIRILPGGSHWTDGKIATYRFMVLLLAGRSLWNAQANTHVGALLFGGLALGSTRIWIGGILASMAMFLKPTIISIPILAMIRRPWQLLAFIATALLLAIVLAGPWTTANYTLWQEWIEHGRASAGERRAAFRDAWTVALSIVACMSGNIPDLETPYPSGWLEMSALLAVTALATGLMVAPGNDRAASTTLSAFLGTAWFLLIGPAIEPPTYLLLGPWVGWALVNRHLAFPQLPIAAAAMILVSFAMPGIPTTRFLAWTPALLPMSVILLIPWYLAAISKNNHPMQESIQ